MTTPANSTTTSTVLRCALLQNLQTIRNAYQRIQDHTDPPTANDCLPCNYALSSSNYLYPIMKVGRQTIGVHIVTMLYKKAILNNDPTPWPEGHDVSHLCSNRRCVNPDHLCTEPHATNQARNGCPPPVRCMSCMVTVSACFCEPECQKPPIGGVCDVCR